MKTGIYKITNPNGKVYIGQAIDIDDRFKDYKTYNCKAQRLIYNSLKKYGWEAHKFEVLILGEFTLEELNELEIKYIKEYNSFRGLSKNGLNLTTGGNVCKRDESSKLMISESLKRFHLEIGHSEDTKQKIANSLKGLIHSEETKEKRNKSRELYFKNNPRPQITKKKREEKRISTSIKKEQNRLRDLEIIKSLKEGIEQKLIAVKYNISPSAITQIKKKNNIIIDNRVIAKGSNNNFSKLSEEQVVEIKKLFLTDIKQQVIANRFNVKLRTIKAIKSGQNWAHIII